MALLVYVSIVLVAVLAILYQVELNSDPVIASAGVTLMRSREDSFKYAANVPNYHKWTLMISKIDEINKTQISSGKTFNLYSRIPLFGEQTIPTKVVAYKPFHRLDLQTHAPLLEMRISMSFTDIRREQLPYTRLDCTVTARRKSLLYYVSVLQGLRFVMTSQLKGTLLNLKLMLQT